MSSVHFTLQSFYKLMKYLSGARRTLDLCVFVFTSAEMFDLVINLQRKGVRVRLITDKEQEGAQGSAVGRFRAEGKCKLLRFHYG